MEGEKRNLSFRLLQEELTPCYAKLSGATVECLPEFKHSMHHLRIRLVNNILPWFEVTHCGSLFPCLGKSQRATFFLGIKLDSQISSLAAQDFSSFPQESVSRTRFLWKWTENLCVQTENLWVKLDSCWKKWASMAFVLASSRYISLLYVILEYWRVCLALVNVEHTTRL